MRALTRPQVQHLNKLGNIDSSYTTAMLTTGNDIYIGTSGNDTFNGTQTTFTTLDTIYGAAGTNTLNLTDTGTAAWTLPAALVSNVQTVSLRNANGTAAVAGVTETSTITAVALSAGQTVSAAGQTLLATTNLSASAVATALAGTATSGTGFTLAGTLAGFTKAAGGAGTNTVVYTSTTATAPVADLVVSGTAQTGVPQVTVLTIATAADATAITYTFNGIVVSAPVLSSTGTGTPTNQADAVAASINAFAGSSIATANAGQITIVSNTPVSLANFAATSLVTTYVLAPKSQTITITTNAVATIGTFAFNGVTYTTATATGDTVTLAAIAFVNKINEVAGANIASNSAGVITIDYGNAGANVAELSYAGSTFSYSSVVNSAGIIAASPVTQTTVQGVAPIAAATYTDTINASNFTGSTGFVSSNSTGAVVVDNLTTQSVSKTAGAGSVTANYKSTATTATVNITDGSTAGAVTISGTGLTNATLSSSGASNTLGTVALDTLVASLAVNAAKDLTTTGITGSGLKTVTASGLATSLKVGTLAASITTFTASALTAGGVTATLSDTAPTAFSFIGGGSNDVITAAATTPTGAVIDAGGGSSDIIVIADVNDLSNSATIGQYRNFEVLRNLDNASQNMTFWTGSGITSLQTDDLGFTNMTASQAANIRVLGTLATRTFTLFDASGSSDTIGLNLAPLTGTTAIDVTALVIAGFETLNVTSSSGTQGNTGTPGSDLSFGTAAQLKNINIAGAYDLAVGLTYVTSAVTLVSNQTGTAGLNLTGAAVVGSTLTTSQQADSVGTDTSAITGGASDFVIYATRDGDDTVGTNVTFVNNTSSNYGSAKIDGGNGIDTIGFLGVSDDLGLVDLNFQYLTNFEKFAFSDDGAISVVSGAFYNTNQSTPTTWNLQTTSNSTTSGDLVVNLSQATANQILTVTANAMQTPVPNISTGSGNDTVTVSLALLTTGGGTYSTGAGNDTLSVAFGAATLATNAQTLIGGLGADIITASGVTTAADQVLINYQINAGDSLIGSNDTITSYFLSNGTARGNVLDFTGTPTIASNITSAAVSGFTAAQLTYSVSTGKLTFAGTSAATLTDAQISTFAQSTFTSGTQSVAYLSATGVGSYVFNNNSAGDSLVYLSNISSFGGVGVDTATTAFINLG